MRGPAIALYLDEHADALVAELLTNRGFTVTPTASAHNLGKTDPEQMAYAAEHRLALVTHNRRHFEDLIREYFETGKDHWGVVIAVRRSPYELARRLLALLNSTLAESMKNQVRYL